MSRLGKGIYKRSDRRYEGRYHKGRKPDGSLLYGHVYARTASEVREKLSQVVVMPEATPTAKGTVVSALCEYISTVRLRLKASTLAVYERYLDKYIKPNLGDMKLAKLTQANVQAFANKLIDDGLSARTVSAVLSFMRAGLSEQSQIFTVKLPKHVQRDAEPLSSDEQKRLETVLADSDAVNNVGITLCLYTGIRIGELCGLTWDDVDFVKATLRIRRTMERIKCDDGGAKTALTALAPKSETSVRSIPLPQFMLNMLTTHKGTAIGEYVISLKNKPIDPRTIQKRFKKVLKVAEIDDVNFHAATRHTFATRALESGMDVKTLSEVLGHRNAAFTLKRYAHSVDGHKRQCMEAVAARRL
ncbi:site-specific integrase [Clostridia bacterium]|nr:site-specific integrase [Clostridia bacterium]